jgi:hypothetical protein
MVAWYYPMILASKAARARLNGSHDRTIGNQYLALKLQVLYLADLDPPVPFYGFREIALEDAQLPGNGQVSWF